MNAETKNATMQYQESLELADQMKFWIFFLPLIVGAFLLAQAASDYLMGWTIKWKLRRYAMTVEPVLQSDNNSTHGSPQGYKQVPPPAYTVRWHRIENPVREDSQLPIYNRSGHEEQVHAPPNTPNGGAVLPDVPAYPLPTHTQSASRRNRAAGV
ncbi:hypothetical protein HDK64DRAFT_258872 [Phyllosticta capitalensis]